MDICLCRKGQEVMSNWPKMSNSPEHLDIKISLKSSWKDDYFVMAILSLSNLQRNLAFISYLCLDCANW